MNTVESKYLSPDKFIKNLKRRLADTHEQLQHAHEGWHKTSGKWLRNIGVFCGSSAIKHAIWGKGYDKIKPGDEVVVVFKVDRVTLGYDGSTRDATISLSPESMHHRPQA